jgi:hypothetical protein
MQDRDYHELGDDEIRRKRAERERAIQRPPGEPIKDLLPPKSVPASEIGPSGPSVDEIGDESITASGQSVRQGATLGGLLINPPEVTYSQLPDGRMFFTVELKPGDYEKLVLADRSALLDSIVGTIRAGFAKLWSLPTA